MLDFMNRETNSDFIFEQIVNIIYGEVTRISLTGEVIQSYGINKDQKSVDKSTEMWLDSIENRLHYDKWYAAHFHTEKQIDKLEILFENYAVL